MSYTIKELSETLNISEKTALRWIDNGLKIIPGGKNPILISGSDLKEFLINKDSKKKLKLKRSEYYCLSCKGPRRAKQGSTKKLKNKKIALCHACGSRVSRIFKPYQKDYKIPPYPV